MPRSKFILLLTIALVLGAGVVVGRLWAKLPALSTTADKPPRNFVADQLNLSDEQQKQMDAIWSETRQKIGATFEQRKNYDKQRDQAITDLLSDEQKVAYDKIMADSRQQRAEMEKERERLVKESEEKTRALLTDEQKKRYDAMPRPPHGPGPRGGPMTGPSSRPSRPRGDHPFDGH